jgi:hypothetical protein
MWPQHRTRFSDEKEVLDLIYILFAQRKEQKENVFFVTKKILIGYKSFPNKEVS